jgi:5-methylcytosine-specific restriction endonuclease McrA
MTREDYQLMEISQGGLCFLCGRPMGAGATDDHLIPRAYGGADLPANVVLVHRRCNQLKGDRLPTVEEVERLVAQRRRSRLGVWPPLLRLLEAEPGREWLAVAEAIRDLEGKR